MKWKWNCREITILTYEAFHIYNDSCELYLVPVHIVILIHCLITFDWKWCLKGHQLFIAIIWSGCKHQYYLHEWMLRNCNFKSCETGHMLPVKGVLFWGCSGEPIASPSCCITLVPSGCLPWKTEAARSQHACQPQLWVEVSCSRECAQTGSR